MSTDRDLANTPGAPTLAAAIHSVEAFATLLAFGIALKLFGLQRVGALLGRLPAHRLACESDPDVRHWAKVVEAMAELQPFKARCLHQCLALYWILRRRGIAVELVMGVQKFPFAAHVWLQSRGEVVHTALPAMRSARLLQSMSVILHIGSQASGSAQEEAER